MPGSERGGTAVNGFLNFYKPVGITSMEALRRVKRITGQRKKVGHAGTMDPLASGVLPICFGQATRLMEQVVSGRKQYRMTVRLGESSTTYDAEGVITQVADPAGLSHQVIHQALQSFIGLIPQIPPMYSALKVDGQRLYDLARAGKEITRRPRTIEIFSITIDSLNLPDLDLTIDCGPGTYMRSVAHDLGQMLGCGGYVTALTRSSCGGFNATDSVTLEQLEDLSPASDWQNLLHPLDWPVRALSTLTVSETEAAGVRNGQPVPALDNPPEPFGPDDQRRVYDPNGLFLALARFDAEHGRWQPTRVFDSREPSPFAGNAG